MKQPLNAALPSGPVEAWPVRSLALSRAAIFGGLAIWHLGVAARFAPTKAQADKARAVLWAFLPEQRRATAFGKSVS